MTKPQPGAAAFLQISQSETIARSPVKKNSNYSRGVIVDKTGRHYELSKTPIRSYTAKLAGTPL